MAEKCMTKTTMKTANGESVQFSDVHWFSYGASDQPNETYTGTSTFRHDGQVWCRYSLNDIEHWKKINIYKRNVREVPQPIRKYDHYLNIKTAKKNDLIKLCRKGLVSKPAAHFYNSIPDGTSEGPQSQVDEESDGDDYEY